MSIRAVLLTPLALSETRPLSAFDPCRGCAAPCDRFDVARCAAPRRSEAGCRRRCDARRACVIGPEHRYTEAAEAHHAG